MKISIVSTSEQLLLADALCVGCLYICIDTGNSTLASASRYLGVNAFDTKKVWLMDMCGMVHTDTQIGDAQFRKFYDGKYLNITVENHA